MRVVFMGTPDFAVPSLERLDEHHAVVGVVTQPDRARGRGRRAVPPLVKQRAAERGLIVLQPERVSEPEAIAALERLDPDVICVAAFGQILPRVVLDIPPQGCINVHASLLPRHRGAAPVQRAILEGDEVTGVSIMRMEEGLDTGPYAVQEIVPVNDLDARSLTGALAEVGAFALVETLARIENGTVHWIAQDDESATYAPKVTPADVTLEPSLAVTDAMRRIRASMPSARSRILVDSDQLELVHAMPADETVAAGVARCVKTGLLLGLADGTLLVDRLKPAGRGEMDGVAYTCGARMTGDASWGPAA